MKPPRVVPRRRMTLKAALRACPFRTVIGTRITSADPYAAGIAAVYASPDTAPGDPPGGMLSDLANTIRAGGTVMVMAASREHRDRTKALLMVMQTAPAGRA